ncbi:hypothetical protein [Limnoglobus roseus]|uniref:Uncharacterized protein n=1 Tax=Limnoglobus roseus TaxID=2598579 RepID=A0A5C1ATB5_9BACT|nr:hypothetical protein [Limnoglobus roseus]QEL20842.1 hypothetical protein PX52LOC_07962 [Limnoglobus roseus]
MFATIWEEFGFRGASILLGLVLGAIIARLVARWQRHCERRRILKGDARDTVVIAHHIVETEDDDTGRPRPHALRIRSLGQDQLARVIPNGHLACVFAHRAAHVTPRHTLISMDGAEGSYLLETLTNFVCDRVGNHAFDHDLYVMAPCCEPSGLAHHQPITVLLISVADLMLFEEWATCRDVQTEHRSDGPRVLTLLEMARRFKEEQAQLRELRAKGEKTQYVETMYLLDLALDKRSTPVPTRPIPWLRYETVLKEMGFA